VGNAKGFNPRRTKNAVVFQQSFRTEPNFKLDVGVLFVLYKKVFNKPRISADGHE
jgi:hypothetical protein